MSNKSKKSLTTIFITIFIDFLGLGIVVPILGPLLFKSTEIFDITVSNDVRTQTLGFIIACFSISQFFSGTYLGSLSDRYGRKKVLFWSLFISLIGYIFFGIGINFSILPLLMVGRGLAGFAAGNLSVVYSAIADQSNIDDKVKNFGLVGVALGLGFICGPVVGGILSDGNLVSWFNHTTPIIFAGILVVINTILVSLFFEETLTEPNPNKQVHILDCFRNIKKATQSTGVLKWIFLLVFLFFSAFTMFSQFIQVFLIEKFNFDAANIGYLFGYLGLWAIITQGFIIRILAKKYNPYQILNVAMIAQAVNYLLLLLPATKGDLYLLMPLFSIAQGLSLPNINATVSNSVSSNVQGETLGVQQSIQSFSQAIIPFIGGSLVSITYNAPFYTGALFMVLSWLVFKFKVLPYLQKRV